MGGTRLHRSTFHSGHIRLAQGRGKSHARVSLRLIPNRDINNNNVLSLAQALASFYEPPINRREGLSFYEQPSASWEIYLTPGRTAWVLNIPEKWEPVLLKELARTWADVTVKKVRDPLPIACDLTAKLALKEHYVFALSADKRSIAPLESLLETLSLMDKNELAVIQILLQPAPPDWWEGAMLMRTLEPETCLEELAQIIWVGTP